MLKLNKTVFVLSMLLLITACDEKVETQTEAPLRPVRTILASASDGISGRDFPGSVIAKNKADLSFRVSGKIKEILIKEALIKSNNFKLVKTSLMTGGREQKNWW